MVCVCVCVRAYLGELIDLLQPLLDLQPASVAGHPVHHGHHRLLDHLTVDEAPQDLGDPYPLLRVPRTELLHLRGDQWRDTVTLSAQPEGQHKPHVMLAIAHISTRIPHRSLHCIHYSV